jgi:hypothetical protein
VRLINEKERPACSRGSTSELLMLPWLEDQKTDHRRRLSGLFDETSGGI